jgi:T5SS/PEP-CTERM-associated repeat protein
MKFKLAIFINFILATPCLYGYTNPIDGQITEIIDNNTWDLSQDLYVGGNTWGNRMVVTNNGFVKNDGGYIGYTSSAFSNSVLITGSGSVWSNSSHLLIGSAGAYYNTLDISDGGAVFNHVAAIGAKFNDQGGSNSNQVRISGIGSLWANSGYLYIGSYGSHNVLEMSNGAAVNSLAGNLGWDTNAHHNSVLVSGSGTVWSNTHHLLVGHQGSGNSLTVSNTATVISTESAIGGDPTASNNLAFVTGSNSSWYCAGNLKIGVHGSNNSLTITNGGFVESEWGLMGTEGGADGNSAIISGSGSVWSNRVLMNLGDEGSGNNMTVSSGGKVYSMLYGADIGQQPTAHSNSVLVTGTDSTWFNVGNLSIGTQGSFNQLSVLDGASVVNDIASVGANTGADNNSVFVYGAGSTWSNRVLVNVGESGSGNHLDISDGGAVYVLKYSCSIGDEAGSSSNSVYISGIGSTLHTADNIYIGTGGSSNSLSILDGGYVENFLGRIGDATGADHNSVLVSGHQSLWLNRMNMSVGDAGSFNHMTITNGGKVLNLIGEIGSQETASNNSVRVTGPGSGWFNYERLFIGQQGSDNRLEISNGGFVRNSYLGVLGFEINACDNAIEITGNDSVWETWDLVAIGGYGSRNRMRIEDGGKVINNDGYIGYFASASNNTATVSGTGSLWRCEGNLYIGGHPEELGGTGNYVTVSNGATISTALLTIHPGNTFHLAPGGRLEAGGIDGDLAVYGIFAPGNSAAFVPVSGALSLETGGTIEIEIGGITQGAEYDHLSITGQTALAGSLDIRFVDGFVPSFGTFDLFDYLGGVSGTFSSVALPAPPFGRVWNTEYLHTTGELIIEPDTADTNGNGIEDGWGLWHFPDQQPRFRYT